MPWNPDEKSKPDDRWPPPWRLKFLPDWGRVEIQSHLGTTIMAFGTSDMETARFIVEAVNEYAEVRPDDLRAGPIDG